MNITENAKNILDNCRFCWMCRHICPIGNATGLERNTARARSFAIAMVVRGATELFEVVDNIYECTLCGACTNNCVTGFDPKVFVQEVKSELVLSGLTPPYILKLIENQLQYGNVFGEAMPEALTEYYNADGEILFLLGNDGAIKATDTAIKAISLLKEAGVDVALTPEQDTGLSIWFLTGKTQETQNAAKSFAKLLNKYKRVVVYDPADLSFIRHEYSEWGIEVNTELISFNDFLISLIKEGRIKVNKSERIYTLEDSYAYARDLDDTTSGRELISYVGESRDMLLHGKEANLAGQLIMNEYMPSVMQKVAQLRWDNAINMGLYTIVTESPSEYVALKSTAPEGYTVLSVEEMLLENM